MTKSVAELVDRFQIEPEAALRVLANMEIDFSECTQEEFDREALRAYEFLVRQEVDPTPRLEKVLEDLRKTNREFTQTLLDIVRPVDPGKFRLAEGRSNATGKSKV